MAFVFISSDALDLQFSKTAGGLREGQTSGDALDSTIRRPYRGIQIKDDTYASLSIFDGRGRPIRLVSSSSPDHTNDSGNIGQVVVYADFILQSINDVRVEKQQIIETFGDSFIYFFGERPRIVTLRGILVNTEDFNWRAQFMSNYENHLRGSRLVQRNARAFLSYDTVVVEGYPINVSAQEMADRPYIVNFEMSMFLTNYHDFSSIGLVDFPGNQDLDAEELVGALNRGLQIDADERPPTVTSEVRAANLFNSPSGAGLSSALRDITKVVNSVFNFVDIIKSNFAVAFLSGRVVTKPIGTAGFFAQIGQEGIVSATSVSQDFLDAAEGRGLTRVIVPRRTNFVVPEQLRTRIAANIDEYPLLVGEQFVRSLDLDRQVAFRLQERQLINEFNNAELIKQNIEAKAEQALLTGIKDSIAFLKAGFALGTTIAAAIEDPLAVVADAFGFSGIRGGQERLANSALANADVLQEVPGSASGVRRLAVSSLANAEFVNTTESGVVRPAGSPQEEFFLNETDVNKARFDTSRAGFSGTTAGGNRRFGDPGAADTSTLLPPGSTGIVPRFPGAPE